jgi:hypothetical protein
LEVFFFAVAFFVFAGFFRLVAIGAVYHWIKRSPQPMQ